MISWDSTPQPPLLQSCPPPPPSPEAAWSAARWLARMLWCIPSGLVTRNQTCRDEIWCRQPENKQIFDRQLKQLWSKKFKKRVTVLFLGHAPGQSRYRCWQAAPCCSPSRSRPGLCSLDCFALSKEPRDNREEEGSGNKWVEWLDPIGTPSLPRARGMPGAVYFV